MLGGGGGIPETATPYILINIKILKNLENFIYGVTPFQ
jgi:hypothetical protein